MEASTFYSEILPLQEKLDTAEKKLELHTRALAALLALVTGKPLMTDELEGLLKELGFVPISPLLVGAAGMPPKAPS